MSRVMSLVLALGVFAGGVAAAQEATPVTAFDFIAEVPAHIHAGTCAAPGETILALGEAGFRLTVDPASSGSSGAAYVGADTANAALVSVTTIETSLDRLLAEEHAIDVHRPAAGDEAATRIACGAIGGFRTGADLVFGLQEVNASRYGGTAWLHDNGDGSTTATLFLVSGLAADAAGAMATPPPAAAAPRGGLPLGVEVTSVVVEDGEFVTDELTLTEDIPTVIHIRNADDRDYRFQIDDLMTATLLPANQLTLIALTTPNGGVFAGRLLDAADGAELSILPVTVIPRVGNGS